MPEPRSRGSGERTAPTRRPAPTTRSSTSSGSGKSMSSTRRGTRSPSGRRMAMPSSDQIAWTFRPRRSPSRASRASAHGAWTRTPNGVSRHSRQSPSSSRKRSITTVVGRQRPVGLALVLEVRQEVLGSRSSRSCAPQALGRRSASRRGRGRLDLADERAQRARVRSAARRRRLPERQLAGVAGCRRNGHPVVADLLDAPVCAEDDDSPHPRARRPSPRRARRRAARRLRLATRNTPYRPRSGIVPPLAMATTRESRGPDRVVWRSQTTRGLSSANSSEG